jgi:hypothetical protein
MTVRSTFSCLCPHCPAALAHFSRLLHLLGNVMPSIAFGTWMLGNGQGPIDLVEQAISVGFDHIGTIRTVYRGPAWRADTATCKTLLRCTATRRRLEKPCGRVDSRGRIYLSLPSIRDLMGSTSKLPSQTVLRMYVNLLLPAATNDLVGVWLTHRRS